MEWEVQEPTVTITASQFWEAVKSCRTDWGGRFETLVATRELAQKLGLEGKP
jgi:hypothetical protein